MESKTEVDHRGWIICRHGVNVCGSKGETLITREY